MSERTPLPTRLWFRALRMSAVVVLLGCETPASTAPTAPGLLAPRLEASYDVSAPALLRCRPLPYDSVTKTIGPKGGSIRVSKHVLVIPDGALSQLVRITLVAPRDTVNRIRFQPEGLDFHLPPALTMSYANCSIGSSERRKRIAYTNDSLEILHFVPSRDDPSQRKVTGRLSHFSEYAVSW